VLQPVGELVIGPVGGPPGLLQVPCRPAVDPSQRGRLGGQSTKVAAVGASAGPQHGDQPFCQDPSAWMALVQAELQRHRIALHPGRDAGQP
jgi:hypothetical protein